MNQVQFIVNTAVKAAFWGQEQHIETVDSLHFGVDETRSKSIVYTDTVMNG